MSSSIGTCSGRLFSKIAKYAHHRIIIPIGFNTNPPKIARNAFQPANYHEGPESKLKLLLQRLRHTFKNSQLPLLCENAWPRMRRLKDGIPEPNIMRHRAFNIISITLFTLIDRIHIGSLV
jgi:hypothetical protein